MHCYTANNLILLIKSVNRPNEIWVLKIIKWGKPRSIIRQNLKLSPPQNHGVNSVGNVKMSKKVTYKRERDQICNTKLFLPHLQSYSMFFTIIVRFTLYVVLIVQLIKIVTAIPASSSSEGSSGHGNKDSRKVSVSL